MENSNLTDFIIIHGCPRSGTYLLVQQLQQYFDVAIPVETHFIVQFGRFIGLWGNLEKPTNRRRLLRAIEAYLRIWTVRGIRSAAPERQVDYSLIPAIEGAEIDAPDYAGMLHEIFARFSDMHEGRAYGDKSAPYEPVDPYVYDRTPGGIKVIHLVRDGRDVCVSWRKQWFGPKTVKRAAGQWTRYVALGRRWGDDNPERYLEISFEDLIRRNAEVREKLGRFLGLAENEEPRTGKIGEVMSQDQSHVRLGQTPDAGAIGQWRSQMGLKEQKVFMNAAGETLRQCGYDTEIVEDHEVFEARASRLILPITGWRNWVLRRLRGGMPLGIRVLQFLRLDVVKLAKFITRH